MTGFNHGLTGAVIALAVKQPALAVPLAFASHFVQDIIPHWDYSVSRAEDKRGHFFTKRFNILLASDFCFSVLLMVILGFMFPADKWRIWFCMIAAASPDLMWAYYRLFIENIKNKKPKYDPLARFHVRVQWSQTPKGFFVEAFWFMGVWMLILSFK